MNGRPALASYLTPASLILLLLRDNSVNLSSKDDLERILQPIGPS